MLVRWRHVVILLIGLWLFFSPWILGFRNLNPAPARGWMVDPVATNAWIVGIMVMVVALLALGAYEKWQGWLGASLGVWLVISPWVTGVSTDLAILLNSVILGALLVVLSVSGTSARSA